MHHLKQLYEVFETCYREMRGSVLLTIGESVTVNLDHMCLSNQSHYSLEVIEFQSELSIYGYHRNE